jgi:hypothetical protein
MVAVGSAFKRRNPESEPRLRFFGIGGGALRPNTQEYLEPKYLAVSM